MGLFESLFSSPPPAVRKVTVKARSKKLVELDKRPLWVREGWKRQGSVCSGEIRGHRGSCICLIEKKGDVFRVWVRYPPRGAFNHWHAGCLRAEKNGWYTLHLAQQPRDGDVDAVIRYLNRWLSECQALDR